MMPPHPDPPLGGKLRKYISFWHTITLDRKVLQLIQGVKFEFEKIPHQNKLPRELKMSLQEQRAMDEKVKELLSNETICEILLSPLDGFVSNAFLVRKCSGGTNNFHFIANLKVLNSHLKKRKFKQCGISSALTLITRGCWLASLDLESSFSHLSIHPDSRCFAVFQCTCSLHYVKVRQFHHFCSITS